MQSAYRERDPCRCVRRIVTAAAQVAARTPRQQRTTGRAARSSGVRVADPELPEVLSIR